MYFDPLNTNPKSEMGEYPREDHSAALEHWIFFSTLKKRQLRNSKECVITGPIEQGSLELVQSEHTAVGYPFHGPLPRTRKTFVQL